MVVWKDTNWKDRKEGQLVGRGHLYEVGRSALEVASARAWRPVWALP